MEPRRISRGNKNFYERACVALHDTRLTMHGQPTLDLLYYVWIIHAKLTMRGSHENPRVEYHVTRMEHMRRDILYTTWNVVHVNSCRGTTQKHTRKNKL